MILTVTPDPVLDKVLMVDTWTPGIPMWCRRYRTSVGGKGLDASIALRHLGQETVGLAFLAGDTGKELSREVEAYGIRLEPVWAEGVTRTAYILTELDAHRHTHIFSGSLEINPLQKEAFLQAYNTWLPVCAWVICGGVLPASLPEDFYRQIVALAVQAGKPVLVDCFRGFMRGALPAHPTVVKLNWREFEWTFDQQAASLEALASQGAAVHQHFDLNTLIITCGPDGMLAFTPEGDFHAVPPRLEAVNAAGAGDTASAALAWRQALNDTWPETLRWAAAVSAAAVLTEGTADCNLEDVYRLLPQVQVRPLSTSPGLRRARAKSEKDGKE